MAEKFRFFDSQVGDVREYNAAEFAEYFETMIDTGLIVGALNELEPSVTGTNMIVTVDTGISFINGRWYENDSTLDNTFDTETLGNDRIDLLVLRLDLNPTERKITFEIVKGTPSPTPIAPTVTRTSVIYELALAEVYITGGQSFITVPDLTDLREITTGDPFAFPSAVSKVLPSIDQTAVDDNTERVAKYGVTTGSANNYLLTVNDVTSYYDGLLINIKANFTNTGASNINVNGLGARNIFFKGSAIPNNYIISGQQYELIYDGTQFNVMNTPEDFGEADDILTKIKTVDGQGSGLSSDLWREFTIYNGLSDIGLTPGTETIETIVQNMADQSIMVTFTGASHNSPEYPSPLGVLKIIRLLNVRTTLEFTQNDTNKKWIGIYYDTNIPKFSGWKEVYHTGNDSNLAKLNASNIFTQDQTISRGAPILTFNETDTGKFFYLTLDGSNFSIREDSTSPGSNPRGVLPFSVEEGIVSIDNLKLRNNSGLLEQSTDGIIWKAVGGVKNIQRGLEATVAGGATVDKTITSVVTNKSMANLLTTTGSGLTTLPLDSLSIQLLNSTTLRIINNGTLTYNNVSWEVIEYN